ncbi:nucleoside hydrolase [Rhodobacteraceae bacterium]|nr:nucleoside hydrolase [Paracoccaceae bacterium]
MSALWVDTDYGFDDLWALLVLGRHAITPAGISLVAGNAPLARVIANARGARRAYGLDAPLFAGAAGPRGRDLETAERVLGPRGMASRGRHLPDVAPAGTLADAVPALAQWLRSARPGEARDILALGPLSNIARLIEDAPEAARKITRLVWMGGSDGAGNHSARAEFNALADPNAAQIVAQADLPLEVVDLMACRKVTFGPQDMGAMDPLTGDLLGGYLDIGLSRGRAGMAIYDPVAALFYAAPERFTTVAEAMDVSITPDDSFGETRFTPAPAGRSRRVTGCDDDIAGTCLSCLSGLDVQ